jgi:hypothetical protein
VCIHPQFETGDNVCRRRLQSVSPENSEIVRSVERCHQPAKVYLVAVNQGGFNLPDWRSGALFLLSAQTRNWRHQLCGARA